MDTAAAEAPALRPDLPHCAAGRWQAFTPEHLQAINRVRRLRSSITRWLLAIELSFIAFMLVLGVPAYFGLMMLGFLVLLNPLVTAACGKTVSLKDELIYSDALGAEDRFVEAWIEVNGIVLGGDRGVVWADSSGYWFLGHRSWFRIAPQDLSIERQRIVSLLPRELDDFGDVVLLRVRNDRAKLRIGLRQLEKDWRLKLSDSGPIPLQEHAASALRYGAFSSLETQLPPLELDPELERPALARAVLDFLLYAAGFGVYCVLFPMGYSGLWWYIAITASLFAIPMSRMIKSVWFGCRRFVLRRKGMREGRPVKALV